METNTNAKSHHRSHHRHIARTAGVRAVALEARLTIGTIHDAVESIRATSRIAITRAEARRRYDACAEAAAQFARECESGDARRASRSRPKPRTVGQRLTHAIRALIDGVDMPGDRYSGDTAWYIRPCGRGGASASTATEYGDRYSKSCKYSKTDATHIIRLSLSDMVAARRAGLPATIDGWIVAAAKQVRPGIYCICQIGTLGKQCASRTMYAAEQGGDGQWYLAKTERGAATGRNRHIRAIDASRAAVVSADVCRNWGWCAQGIRDWCARHNIRRDVSARLRAGASSAALARLIARHGGPRDGYERRLIRAASAA